MSLNSTITGLEDEILSVLTSLKSAGLVPYFEKVEKGRLRGVDIFPCAFFWTDPTIPMGNDYITGDLIKQGYTIAGFDYDNELMGSYELAEARSLKIATDLRDEFSKWENRNLQGSVFQSQAIEIFVDPGAMPFGAIQGALMAAGGIKLLVVYRQNRGS